MRANNIVFILQALVAALFFGARGSKKTIAHLDRFGLQLLMAVLVVEIPKNIGNSYRNKISLTAARVDRIKLKRELCDEKEFTLGR